MILTILPYFEAYVEKVKNAVTKNTIIVLKGWYKSFISEIENAGIERLLDIPFDIPVQELLDLQPAMTRQTVMKDSNSMSSIYWCTYEEYLMLEKVIPMFFDIRILNNNIFYKTYPCIYEIKELDYISDYFNNESIQNEESEENEQLNRFLSFYGNIVNVNGKSFINYNSDNSDLEDQLFSGRDSSIPTLSTDMNNSELIELTEDEQKFLEVIDNLVNRNNSQDINLAYSVNLENNLNYYKERVSILHYIFKNTNKFFIATKSLEEVSSFSEDEYLAILKKYWGYNSFRNLKMYKNVNKQSNYNEVIEIPQSQIIHEIVQQAEKAMNIEDNYGNFRDIFVTSPTGAGKSVMFQIPAIYLAQKYQAMTIVISPLIGLMIDQVEGLENKKISMAATINSQISPVEKIEIIKKIAANEISILYISPETLLSRSDIENLIGKRKIGLFVIDEAHIVTTWGKSFRADYWYLGSYLQKLRKPQKLREPMNFPIATFTATAIYGGPEDMYSETRDSLNLVNPVTYLGYIKRDDIEIKIKTSKNDNESEKSKEYREKKMKLMTFRLEAFVKAKQKSLVYFPTVSLIYDFLSYVKLYGSSDLINNICIYHGQLGKLEKNENYLRYKNNDALIMLATKAFGMGIDIPDICNVYHFAPTGNVCDYVQEVGRAARALDSGCAYLDYLSKDFTHVNRLHGISTLRKNQLIQVIDKVLKLFYQQGEKRNLLVSSEEFKYIFTSSNMEDEDIDNKFKTALLILEKDFQMKFQYSPLIGRPRSLFTVDYFIIPENLINKIFRHIGSYLSIHDERNNNLRSHGNIYRCDMKGLWEDKYKNLSFPKFKYMFYSNPEELNFEDLSGIIPVLWIDLQFSDNTYSMFLNKFDKMLQLIEDIFGSLGRSAKYFDQDYLTDMIVRSLKLNKYFCENLTDVLLNSMQYFQRLKRSQSNFYKPFLRFHENSTESINKYSIQNSGYQDFFGFLRNKVEHIFNLKGNDQSGFKVYITKPKNDKIYLEQIFICLGLIESMGLAVYQVNGGDSPQVFIRINSKMRLERVVHAPDKYENIILKNVKDRHYISVKMLKYLFENQIDTVKFWDLVEDYFLGHIPESIN